MLLWRRAPRIWQAKGYTHTTAADALMAKFGTGKGFSRSKISLLVTTHAEPCPPKVEDFIINEMKVLNEERWAKYLREVANEPAADAALPPLVSEPREVREVAREAAAEIGNMVRGWLDAFEGKLEALGKRAEAVFAAVDGKLEALASSARVALDSAATRLAALQATLNHSDAKIDVLETKLDASEARRRKDKRDIMAVVCGTGLVIVLAMHCDRAPTAVPPALVTASPTPAPVQQVIVNVGTGVGVESSRFLGAIASAEMGKKSPAEQFIPDRPLPGQKLPPCDPGLRETDINGGCWGEMKGSPPCEKLFRHGDGCYRPIAADPTKPVGLMPEQNMAP